MYALNRVYVQRKVKAEPDSFMENKIFVSHNAVDIEEKLLLLWNKN